MILGEVLLSPAYVLTPWMSRQADNAIFTCEVIVHSGTTSPYVDFEVFHKDKEEAGPGSDAGAAETTSTGPETSSIFISAKKEGLKELVRFAVKQKSGSIFTRVRFLQPTWYNTTNT